MSFYHILPSDAARNRFPNNKAAEFSIPIDDAQTLTGQWEVAVAQLTYSNCLYTFDHETIIIGEPASKAFHYETGCRVHIPRWNGEHRESVSKFILEYLNKVCKKIVTLTPSPKNYRAFKHEVEPGWIVCLSPRLRHDLGSIATAFTPHDVHLHNYFVHKPEPMPFVKDIYYVDIIPTNDKTLVKKIVLKTKNSDMTIDTLVKKFNYHLQVDGEKVATISYHTSGHLVIDKLKDDDLVLVCSEGFHKFLNHRTAALHGKYNMRYLAHNYRNQFPEEWSVSLYKKNVKPLGSFSFKTKVLENRIIRSTDDAVTYLNNVVDDLRIHFKVRNNVLSLSVGGKKMMVKMGDALRDILGFDQNTFYSGSQVQAKDVISLTRRINYFQIYSNIGVNVRVGDIEAQLLTMIPFNPKDCSILSERYFKKLHYVDVKSNYIPQIDISIYDDAGALIPFHKDAITTITLHFRRKI